MGLQGENELVKAVITKLLTRMKNVQKKRELILDLDLDFIGNDALSSFQILPSFILQETTKAILQNGI